MATRVRDWATYDFYELLGVDADASSDEIARAFRAAAKLSHPDATGDPDEADHFKDLAAAYTVLSDRRARRDYDRVRATVAEPSLVPPSDGLPRSRWTRRRAAAALIAGLVVTVLGLVATGATWYLHDRDATTHSQTVPAIAHRMDNGKVFFDTADGRRVIVPEPTRHGDPTGTGPTVRLRYDPNDPTHVIVDTSTFARDITLAIVAIKFLIGGLVFIALGAYHLRRQPMMRQ